MQIQEVVGSRKAAAVRALEWRRRMGGRARQKAEHKHRSGKETVQVGLKHSGGAAGCPPQKPPLLRRMIPDSISLHTQAERGTQVEAGQEEAQCRLAGRPAAAAATRQQPAGRHATATPK